MTTPNILISDGCTSDCFQNKTTVNVKLCVLFVNFYKRVVFLVRELSCPAIITSE
jgi:hypothetical protein